MNNSLPDIDIIQHNPKVGDIDGNLEKIEQKVVNSNADLVITPELSLLGYPPRDILHRNEILDAEKSALRQIKNLTENNPAIIVGHSSKNNGNGPPLKNSASVFNNGDKIAQYDKRLLPTYDIFDEHRYFQPGDGSTQLNLFGYNIGITICEDAWYDHYVTGNQRHDYNPVSEYTGCDIVVNLSASPFKVNKFQNREERFANHAEDTNSVYVFANQVGGNDDILFDGTSFIVDSNGQTIYRGPFGKPHLCRHSSSNTQNSYEIPSETEQIRTILKRGIKDYIQKTGFEEVVIGLSGGIDSTVTANLAVDAIGKDNVYGVTLPSSVSSDKNITDAEKVADNLGIRFNELNISDINEQYVGKIKEGVNTSSGLKTITKENIQARIRGVILMGIANDENRLVLTPDNKSEAAVGYCTLYGDAVGAIGPLGDCTKDRVYDLARSFNKNPANNCSNKPIPESVISKDPTAELSEDQKDTDDIPPYDVIDTVVKLYVEEDKTLDEMNQLMDVDKSVISDVISRITRSEFKRNQTPPSLRITDKAFDSGWRYPIAASYDSIIDQ